jgi:transcriptional regulator with XRE-family HTH domain/SAM-dependent methyltransferase
MQSVQGANVNQILAQNLIRLRTQRSLSLTGLAERSGVAKATLSTLEAGRGNPTLETLWAVANALDVPFGTLLAEASVTSEQGVELVEPKVRVRFIERTGDSPEIEVYTMQLEAHGRREAVPHQPGVRERLTVLRGPLLVGPSATPSLLQTGDTLTFAADQPHIYAALETAAAALVVVEYPQIQLAVHASRVIQAPPRCSEDWDGLLALLRRTWTEVAQGLPAFRLDIEAAPEQIEHVALELRARLDQLQQPGFAWPLKHFVTHTQAGVALLTFAWPRGTDALGDLSPDHPGEPAIGADTRLQQAVDLAAPALHSARPLTPAFTQELEALSRSDALTLSSIAAEILTQAGWPTIPSHASAPVQLRQQPTSRGMADEPLFEDRIDVHAYDAFELLHPAYARQVVVLAQLLEGLRPGQAATLRALDVGSGPGFPLRMLLELVPALTITAVEPSPAAFAYLQRNVAHIPTIQLVQADFLTGRFSQTFDLITSVGASHHLNTAFFLQRAAQLLQPGGLLLVADEFIAPYRTEQERARELIRHHGTYLLATLVALPGQVHRQLAPDEIYLVDLLANAVPQMVYAAESDQVERAVMHCRRLFRQVRERAAPSALSHPLMAFYWFQTLELEALVAGLDYEVERKTFPERFTSLARVAGLTLRAHQRVYATTGDTPAGGGTHVFAFEKR